MELKPENAEAGKGKPTEFGYALFRDHILPSVLGRHEEEILYWAGKELASEFPLFDMDEAAGFFLEAGWGMLSRESAGKREIIYVLESDAEQVRKSRRCYAVEAGFLAAQYQKIHDKMAECRPEPDRRQGIVRLTLAWD
jgi:predicted hydrocarbon binding protein